MLLREDPRSHGHLDKWSDNEDRHTGKGMEEERDITLRKAAHGDYRRYKEPNRKNGKRIK